MSVAIGAAFVSLPYYVMAPGTASSVDGLVKVQGADYYPPKGRVLMTTVSLGEVRNIYDFLVAKFDPNVDIVGRNAILPPNVTPSEFDRQNLADMADSKQLAEYVALRRLGYEVPVRGQGALIAQVVDKTPAVGVLHAGDVIVAADHKPVSLAEDLVKVILSHKPGDQLLLTVRTGPNTQSDVTVKLAARPDGTAMVGIALSTYKQTFAFPFNISITSGDIGGPSAGLAFTLTLIDLLTPGELTGGVPIAATGTIESDGSVGPVGGVAQKTVAVRDAGAKLFLVPSDEYAAAKAHAGKSLRVEKADTLDQALKILATLPGSNAADILARKPAA